MMVVLQRTSYTNYLIFSIFEDDSTAKYIPDVSLREAIVSLETFLPHWILLPHYPNLSKISNTCEIKISVSVQHFSQNRCSNIQRIINYHNYKRQCSQKHSEDILFLRRTDKGFLLFNSETNAMLPYVEIVIFALFTYRFSTIKLAMISIWKY